MSAPQDQPETDQQRFTIPQRYYPFAAASIIMLGAIVIIIYQAFSHTGPLLARGAEHAIVTNKISVVIPTRTPTPTPPIVTATMTDRTSYDYTIAEGAQAGFSPEPHDIPVGGRKVHVQWCAEQCKVDTNDGATIWIDASDLIRPDGSAYTVMVQPTLYVAYTPTRAPMPTPTPYCITVNGHEGCDSDPEVAKQKARDAYLANMPQPQSTSGPGIPCKITNGTMNCHDTSSNP